MDRSKMSQTRPQMRAPPQPLDPTGTDHKKIKAAKTDPAMGLEQFGQSERP